MNLNDLRRRVEGCGVRSILREGSRCDPKYLGIQIFRFYLKCSNCSTEITFKTDPQNSDYVVESGATRNFKSWREEDEELKMVKRQRDFEEMGDSMKSLENRALDSKHRMDAIVALDEIKFKKNQLEKEDEELVKSVIFKGTRVSEKFFYSTNSMAKASMMHSFSDGGNASSFGACDYSEFAVKSSSAKVAIVKKTGVKGLAISEMKNQGNDGTRKLYSSHYAKTMKMMMVADFVNFLLHMLT